MQLQASHNLSQLLVFIISGISAEWAHAQADMEVVDGNGSAVPVFGVLRHPTPSGWSMLGWESDGAQKSARMANVSNGTLSFMVLPDQVMEA
eukprot:1231165-Rhodomonas_salina.1